MTPFERENYSDESDRATALEMREVESSRARAAKLARRDQEPNADGIYEILECVECGTEIGEDRIRVAIKNTLCIYCATEQEQRRR